MPKSQFYAVRAGGAGPFVYSTWEGCERAVKGYSRAKYKKFIDYAEAERWIRSTSPDLGLENCFGESNTPSRTPKELHPDVTSSTRSTRTRTHRTALLHGRDAPLSRPAQTPHKSGREGEKTPVICLLESSSDIEEQSLARPSGIIELSSDSEMAEEPAESTRPRHRQHSPPEAKEERVSPEQQRIFDLVVKDHKSVFFTGSAGTGKSFLLRKIIQALPPHGTQTAVTAPTGIAAVNIGGCTLHSWAGIGLGKGEPEDLLLRLGGFARKRWKESLTLIIDEISMCDGALLDKLDYIGRRACVLWRFFQLPPVPDELHDMKVPITFAFEARCWREAVPRSYTLTHVFRQKEQVFIDILNEARTGTVSADTIAVFRQLDRPLQVTDGIEPTRIFPKKDQVKQANDKYLAALRTPARTFIARDFAGTDSYGNPISFEAATKKLDRNVVAPASITLKEGAQVMLVANLDTGLVNGSQGVVVGFNTPLEARDKGFQFPRAKEADLTMRAAHAGAPPKLSLSRGEVNPAELENCHWPIVKFNNGDTFLIQPAQFSVVNVQGRPEAQRDQVPLILAWALSVHKAQGQTLERVNIDLTEVFEKGQAYVAMSRATTLQGLKIVGFSPEKVMAHIRVIEWAKSLRTIDENGRLPTTHKRPYRN